MHLYRLIYTEIVFGRGSAPQTPLGSLRRSPYSAIGRWILKCYVRWLYTTIEVHISMFPHLFGELSIKYHQHSVIQFTYKTIAISGLRRTKTENNAILGYIKAAIPAFAKTK